MEAVERKTSKYIDLQESTVSVGYRVSLLTIEVGSHELPHTSSFTEMMQYLVLTKRTQKLMTNSAKEAINGSYLIRKSRNNRST